MNSSRLAVLEQNAFNRTVRPDIGSELLHFANQGIHYAGCFVRHREHAPIVLFFEPDAEFLEEGHDIPIVPMLKSAI